MASLRGPPRRPVASLRAARRRRPGGRLGSCSAISWPTRPTPWTLPASSPWASAPAYEAMEAPGRTAATRSTTSSRPPGGRFRPTVRRRGRDMPGSCAATHRRPETRWVKHPVFGASSRRSSSITCRPRGRPAGHPGGRGRRGGLTASGPRQVRRRRRWPPASARPCSRRRPRGRGGVGVGPCRGLGDGDARVTWIERCGDAPPRPGPAQVQPVEVGEVPVRRVGHDRRAQEGGGPAVGELGQEPRQPGREPSRRSEAAHQLRLDEGRREDPMAPRRRGSPRRRRTSGGPPSRWRRPGVGRRRAPSPRRTGGPGQPEGALEWTP